MAVRQLSSSDCLASPDPRGKAPHDGHAEPGVRTASLGSSFRSTAPKRVTVKNTWSMASVATRFLFGDAQSKARQPRASPAKFTSRGAALRPFVLPAAPAIMSPTLAPEGLGGRLLPSPRSSSMDIGQSRCGHGDRRAIEPILAAADAGRETPEDPHRAAPRFLRGNLGIPSASSRGKPAGSTCTVQRPSPELSPRCRAPAPARARGSPGRPAPGERRPAPPCVGEKVPSRGGRAPLQPTPQAAR